MHWLHEIALSQSVTWTVLVLAVVAVTGLALAQVKIKGIGIGVTGVLFAGILAGHLGLQMNLEVLEFIRDFGLMLFVFTIGLQLGPGFFASFRKEGLKMNVLAVAIVLIGAIATIGSAWLLKINPFASLGLFSGATTNTPSLGATQQMLKSMGGHFAEQAGVPPLAYAAAYPGAVAGIITVILLIRLFMGKKAVDGSGSLEMEKLERINLLVKNPRLEGRRAQEAFGQSEVVFSRIKKSGSHEIATVNDQTVLHQGDILLAVGKKTELEKLSPLVGHESNVDLRQANGKVMSKKIFVTQKNVLGKTFAELDLAGNFGVVPTRLLRGDVELTPAPEVRLRFGDRLQIVGPPLALGEVACMAGNQSHVVRDTNFLPIFLGIGLGILAGAIPIKIPGIPVPVQLGIAGGPLVLAILLGRLGRLGPLIWYMPAQANAALREFGIILFLGCVGLKAGAKFFETVFTMEGLHWMLAGLLITMVPLLIVAFLARFICKYDFPTISGLISGSMTDPPALAFAHAITRSETPLAAYATVYPLAMLLRIFTVQIMALITAG